MIAQFLFFSLVLLSISVNGQCPAGQFVDGRFCCNCDTVLNCRQVTCSRRGSSTCAKCLKGYVLNAQGRCVQDCPSTQFWDAKVNQCCSCGTIENCLDRSCSTKDQVVCHSCRSGYTLVNNQCKPKPTCVAPQFFDAQYNQCCDCTQIQGCKSRHCSNKNDQVCTECSSGFVLINGQCQTKPNCANDQFYKANTNQCVNCPTISNCGSRTCPDQNSAVCIRCASGFYLKNNRCEEVPRCTGTTFYDAQSNTCRDCTSINNCVSLTCTCKGATTCTQCRSGFVLRDNQCVAVPDCNPPTFYHAGSNTCRECKVIAGCASRTCRDASSSTCQRCQDGFVLRNNECQEIPKCTGASFYDAQYNTCCECTKIDNCNAVKALTCTSKTTSVCTQCRAGFVLRNNKCVDIPDCKEPTYYDASSNTCVQCPNVRNCISVTCSSPTSTTCTRCQDGYVLRNGACQQIVTCTGATWYDSATNTCPECAPFANCAVRTCSTGGVSTCGQCANGFVLINGRCDPVPKCTGSTFYDAALNVCSQCNEINNCVTVTCSTKNSPACIRCADGFVLRGNKCDEIPTCTGTTFYDAAWNKCCACTPIQNCVTLSCISATQSTCGKCAAGFFLKNNQCVENPTCTGATFFDAETNTCPPCTGISNCAVVTCRSQQSSTCGKCAPGFFLQNNQCVPFVTCTGATFFDANTNTCPECPAFENCASRTCQNAGSSVCTACKPGFVMRNGQCVEIPTCTGATFYDAEWNFCCSCTPIAKCTALSCTSKAESTCTACEKGFVLKNGRCVEVPTCTGATFLDVPLNFCCDCSPILNCVSLTCTSKTDSSCSKCAAGFVLKNNQCVVIPTCVGATWYDATTNTCPECPAIANCATRTCQTSGSPTTCSRCVDGFVLRNGVCELIPKCTGATFLDASANQCVPCTVVANCAVLSCDGPGASTCSGCVSGFVLRNGQCLEIPKCTGATFLDAPLNQCIDCTPIDNCVTVTCTSKAVSTCGQCQPGFILRNNQCIKIPTCTAGTFYDETTISCPPCASLTGCSSVTCSSSSTSKCVDCKEGFFLKQGVCEPFVVCSNRQYRNVDTNTCIDCVFPTGCSDGLCAASGLTCNACADGFILLNGVCVDIPDCTRAEYYTKNDNLCHPCKFPTNCRDGSCQTATDAVCEVCETGFALLNNACPAIPDCTDSQYYKKNTNECVHCPLSANCVAGFCSDPSNLRCTRCAEGFVNMNGVGCVAIPKCTSTQFLDKILNVCQDCTKVPNCNDYICTDQQSTVCIKCAANFVVRGQICAEIPQCQPGTFLDMNTLTCPPCPAPSNCLTVDKCTKATDSTCKACKPGFVLKNKICVPVPVCKTPTVLNPATNLCAPCQTFVPNCAAAICSSSTNAACTRCNPGWIAEDGECFPGGPPPKTPSGSGSVSYSFANGADSATETTTVSQDGSGSTTVTTSSDSGDNHGFAIAVGIFAGIAVALLITLVVVIVMRNSRPEKV